MSSEEKKQPKETTEQVPKQSPKWEAVDYSDYDDWEPELRKRKGNGGFQYYGSSKHIRKTTAKYQ